MNNTLSQLPNTAAEYYRVSVADTLFERVLVGKDDLGRRIYQKYLSGELYGAPRALLTYAEYSKKVKEWAKKSNCMGVDKWTEPYFRD